ncbi:MAG TPA: tRNA lysidine(34) synthetase TilS [Croceibacterium sp.]|nr:tRNA lysidine(34) synthetase TilS [Croceibacterium sp.]
MTATGTRSAAPADLPPELVARFAQALERLWPEGGKLGLAVSGGPDSMAMLLLAHAAIPGKFEVGTVDHGLRAESAAECAMVASACAARGIRCEVLKATVAPGNVQSRARSARYGVLAGWAERHGLAALATAHHADDQAETLLMRLNRGSGVAGLAGVREIGAMPGCAIPVIRPLLGFRRADLAGVVAASGLEAVHDPGNVDDRFDRARLRKAIGESPWLDVAALAQSAAHLADAEEALQWGTNRQWSERVTGPPDCLRFRPGTPAEITRRIVSRAIANFGDVPRGGDVARLIERLARGESGSLGGALVTVEGDEWVFRPEPARRNS